jgi:hypothetical protein
LALGFAALKDSSGRRRIGQSFNIAVQRNDVFIAPLVIGTEIIQCFATMDAIAVRSDAYDSSDGSDSSLYDFIPKLMEVLDIAALESEGEFDFIKTMSDFTMSKADYETIHEDTVNKFMKKFYEAGGFSDTQPVFIKYQIYNADHMEFATAAVIPFGLAFICHHLIDNDLCGAGDNEYHLGLTVKVVEGDQRLSYGSEEMICLGDIVEWMTLKDILSGSAMSGSVDNKD